MANDPHWIEHMHMHKGAFGAKAKKAGESTSEYAKDKEHTSGKTGDQARLAVVLNGLRKAKG